jgi:VCBS repeat-containing protein
MVVAVSLLVMTSEVRALIITRTSDSVLYIDTSAGVYCSYTSYQIVNNDAVAYSNLWVKMDSFSSTILKLGGGGAGQFNLGSMAVNQTNTVFFYVQASNTTATAQSHAIRIFRGRPDIGTQLTNQTFTLTVDSAGQNSSSKITGSSAQPNPATVGGSMLITISGTTGQIGGPNKVNFTPAVYTNWDAASYQLVSCSVDVSGGNTGSYSNTLVIAFASSADTAYTAKYWFRAIAITGTNQLSPLTIVSGGGGNYSHAAPPATGILAPILPATNQTTLTNFASVSQLYTNELVTFTTRFTNSSANSVQLDAIVNTLPAGFSYVTNTSRFNGSAVANPAISNQFVTWSEPYQLPAGASRDFTFQATPVSNGFATNFVVAYVKDTQIDTTLLTTDNSPGRAALRVLLEPRATNDVATTLEDAVINLSAPGVLANDSEPNGFTLSVASYTQPASGTVTVNANGSFTYTPTTNLNGADSFTYTLTNGNARASTATVNLTVTTVNDAPTINAISNLALLEDASAQIVNLSGLTTGAANESQTLTITATSSNPSLIPDPSVSYTSPNATGALNFTPVANASGTATITVIVQDNGGTANGGVAAVTNTFTVTVTAVNDAPTLAAISNVVINEDAGAQTVNLSGITTGAANESQTLTVTATSSNPLLVPHPSVTYTSPNATGTLDFTPVTHAFGSCVITVIVQDNGGTANGGVTAVTNTFSVTINPVNDAPTLSVLPDLVLTESAGLQTVNLTGISAGGSGETQTLSITASSSNPSLFPTPSINYTSPNATGTLTFTPANGAIGTSVITVIVQDDGGTASGGVSAVTNTFTVTVLIQTNVWNAGASLTVGITNAAGTAGNGYAVRSYTGVLDVQASSGNPFVIRPASFIGGTAGWAENFTNDQSYSFTIATATRGVIGFTTNKFAVDTSSFSNDLAGGTFYVALSADSNSVLLLFTNNHAPTASAVTYGRALGTALRIPLFSLLTNYTGDIDGDARALSSLAVSTNGSFVSTNATHILFAPTNNVAESFAYVVRDVRAYRPGDTVRTATNWITINVTNAIGSAQLISVSGNSIVLRLAGVPGYAYDVERAPELSGPWTLLSTTNAPPAGVWEIIDTDPLMPSGFYRTKQH